ncbi:hypothetical protein CWT12_04785 [Actinomyces sp. 432]|nr:hypothetical protein CWT12_04785 [Actinomyces sp. 432]
MVTAESLSTDRYIVTSIPEDLDAQQTEVLKAFINYDQVTWNIWFTGTGVENAQPLMTAEAYQTLKDNYEPISDETVEGSLRVAITSVAVTAPDPANKHAEVRVCSDHSDLVAYDANGNDVSNPETLQGRYEYIFTMVYEHGSWKDSNEELISSNECVA